MEGFRRHGNNGGIALLVQYADDHLPSNLLVQPSSPPEFAGSIGRSPNDVRAGQDEDRAAALLEGAPRTHVS
jgi:hypothetical protein